MTVYESETAILDLEYNEQFFIVHVPFLEVSVQEVKTLKAKIDEIAEFAETVGYSGVHAGVPNTDSKAHKLARLLGGHYIGEAEETSVYEYKCQQH